MYSFSLVVLVFQCIENLAMMAEEDNISVASRHSLSSVRSVEVFSYCAFFKFGGS